MSSSILTRQPGKGLFTILTIIWTPLKLAFLFLYYLPRSLREHPQWTYHQALGRSVVKMLLVYASAVRFRTQKNLEPGADKERFITMEAAEPKAYRDIIDDSKVRPGTIGGMWYPKLYPEGDGNLVVLHFHGGAYVLGGCRPKEGGWGPDMLAKCLAGYSLCPQYRLARDQKTCFPAAIQDGVTAYQYLLSKGVSASNIVLSGDSAGGNLAITLLRYLAEHEGGMSLPRAVFLWSPWLDMGTDISTLEKKSNFSTDYLPTSLVRWATEVYPGRVSLRHPYLSPLGNEFVTKVPIFLHTCTAELLHDDHMKFAKSMKEIGNRLKLFVTENAPHDIFAGGPILGFAKEAVIAMKAASAFLQEMTS
jgi:acetyl esterase/lipase